MIRILLIGLLVGSLGGAVSAQEAHAQKILTDADAAKTAQLRYRFSHTADGVMRLDNQTGEVMMCHAKDGAFVCKVAPEETGRLQNELKRKTDDLDQLKSQMSQLQTQLSVPAASDGASKGDVETLQAESAALMQDIAGLKKELAALKKQLTELSKGGISQEERRDMVSRIALLEQDNGGLKGTVVRLEAENAELKKQLEAQGTELKKQIAALPAPENLKPDVAQLQQDNSELKRTVARLDGQNADLKKQLEMQNAELKKQIAAVPAPENLKPDVAQLQQENGALRGDLATLKERLANLSKDVAAQDDRATQRAQIERLVMENAGLKDQVATLQSEAASMRERIAALEPPPPPVPPVTVPPPKDRELRLPSRADLDRAGAILADAWRRMVEMIDNLRKDMTRKDDNSVRL